MNKLTIYNLSVCLETYDITVHSHLTNFLDKYYTIKSLGFSSKVGGDDKVFIGKIRNKNIFHMHSNQFVHFYHYLKEINYNLVIDEKIDKRDYYVSKADMSMRDNWVLRDNQIPIRDFLVENPTKSKLVPLQTGFGKGIITLAALAELKKRTAIVVLSKFAEKWIIEIAEKHNTTTKDVMLIQGSKSLAGLIQMAKNNELTNNYYVFSAETLQYFLTAYETNQEDTIEQYGCSPMELFPLIGIGIMVNDESHLSFHLLYKIIVYTNVEYQIGLTATLISDNPTLKRMYKIIYPSNCIYGEGQINKYIDVYPISYTINNSNVLKLIKTTNFGSSNYSHIAFEKSISRRDILLRFYYKLIDRTIQDYYIQDYKDNDKLIIFVSTVDMASKLTSYLKEMYTDKDVRRYCQEDPYEDLINGEIVVTTVISAGTGVDIPNLRVVIQTVSISSPQSNLQSLGRLRKLNDRDVKFCYLYCENISKQKQYHLRRTELFREYVASVNLRRSPVNLN